MSKLRIVALGGLDEDGKSLYCLEIEDKIIIVNAGIKYPEENQYGVEFIVPDYQYLEENQSKIVGIILTHCHDDMMNGLPSLLKEIDAPVYGSEVCYHSLKLLMKPEALAKVDYHEVERNSEFEVGGIKVHSFGLTHTTIGAMGIAIDTPDGQIVICEQFVVDFDMHDKGFDCDLASIAEIGKNKVLVLMMEASYADKEAFTTPKHKVSKQLKPVFEDAGGRIIVTVYEQNFLRIKEIVAMAKEYNKAIYFYDPKLRQYVYDVCELGYYNLPKGLEIAPEKFSNDIENIVIIVTAKGKNIFDLMNRIAMEEEQLELRESDTVVIASPVAPGYEKNASAMENELYKDNVDVVKLDAKEVLSAHPSSEDLKMFLNLLKPKYFIPVMGEYRNFVQAANLAMQVGFTPDRIIILDNGQVATFDSGNLISCAEMISVGDFMVGDDENNVIASYVLKDRETLSTDGVIIIGITISHETKEVIAGPDVQSRGVIYVKDAEYVLKNVSKMTVEMIEEKAEEGHFENSVVRSELRERVARYVLKETGKRPMILPAIIEINL